MIKKRVSTEVLEKLQLSYEILHDWYYLNPLL